MTRVIMKTISAGPDGSRHPNEEHDVPEKEAAELVAGHFAEYAANAEHKAREDRKRQTVTAEAETAMDDTMGETADAPPIYRSRQRGGKA